VKHWRLRTKSLLNALVSPGWGNDADREVNTLCIRTSYALSASGVEMVWRIESSVKLRSGAVELKKTAFLTGKNCSIKKGWWTP